MRGTVAASRHPHHCRLRRIRPNLHHPASIRTDFGVGAGAIKNHPEAACCKG
jgi:hypothetical protein